MEIPSSIVPKIANFDFSFVLSVPVLLGLLGLFFVFYAVVTAVLMYHWSRYGMKNKGIILGETIFLFVSIVLFTGAGVSLFYF